MANYEFTDLQDRLCPVWQTLLYILIENNAQSTRFDIDLPEGTVFRIYAVLDPEMIQRLDDAYDKVPKKIVKVVDAESTRTQESDGMSDATSKTPDMGPYTTAVAIGPDRNVRYDEDGNVVSVEQLAYANGETQ
jgi:hypothetical protein